MESEEWDAFNPPARYVIKKSFSLSPSESVGVALDIE